MIVEGPKGDSGEGPEDDGGNGLSVTVERSQLGPRDVPCRRTILGHHMGQRSRTVGISRHRCPGASRTPALRARIHGRTAPNRADFWMRDWDGNSRRLLVAAILLAWFTAYKYLGLL